jgi:hypothetical protein
MNPRGKLRPALGLIAAGIMALAFVVPVCAQTLVESPLLPEAPSHSFLDKSNKIRLSVLAGLVAADGITTHNVIAHHYGTEVNPLARPLVMEGGAGQAAASVLGYGATLGTSYLLHRTGHHKLERWVLNVGMGVEVECITNNLIQSATAPVARHSSAAPVPGSAPASFRSGLASH